MAEKLNNKEIDSNEFYNIIEDITQNEVVQKMKLYRQHADVNCFEHCYHVSYHCYKIARKMNMEYEAVTRAAMLHDLFLYDWREKTVPRRWHAFTHGKLACDNASKLFDLTDMEKDMIRKHMWPTTPIPPKSKEGFLLSFVDKYCAIVETGKYVFKKIYSKNIVRYASVFMGFIF